MTKGKSNIIDKESPELRRSSNKGPEKRIEAGDSRSPSLELIEKDSSGRGRGNTLIPVPTSD